MFSSFKTLNSYFRNKSCRVSDKGSSKLMCVNTLVLICLANVDRKRYVINNHFNLERVTTVHILHAICDLIKLPTYIGCWIYMYDI